MSLQSSPTGMMGGKVAHEFIYLSDGGEDTVVYCENCDYKSNMEVAVSRIKVRISGAGDTGSTYSGIIDIERLAEYLNIEQHQTMKPRSFPPGQ